MNLLLGKTAEVSVGSHERVGAPVVGDQLNPPVAKGLPKRPRIGLGWLLSQTMAEHEQKRASMRWQSEFPMHTVASLR